METLRVKWMKAAVKIPCNMELCMCRVNSKQERVSTVQKGI